MSVVESQPVSAATKRLSDWLSAFSAALESRDIDTAVSMFGEETYWRDLVSFTWNFKTVEGRDGVRDMLEACLDRTAPSDFRIVGEANEADGITDGWFDFDTGLARGHGQIRLAGDECFTLLTTMVELKGHEEQEGPGREKGIEHGVVKGRKSWLEQLEEERANLGYNEQPYCVIVGGGRAVLPSVPGCADLACQRSSSKRTNELATRGASGTSHSAFTIRCGTTIFRT